MENKQADKQQEQEKRLTFRVPAWMHKAAKVRAAQMGKTVEQALSEVVEAWLKENPEVK